MSVRKTESRIPDGMTPADLGEAAISADGQCCLVSCATSPIGPLVANRWIVFVTDNALASSVKSYQWYVEEDGAGPYDQRTETGTLDYQPNFPGNISVFVDLLDAADKKLNSVSIAQQVGMLNPTLEAAISASAEQPGPGVGNIYAIRELVNNYYSYYQSVSPIVSESGDAFKEFVCDVVLDGLVKNDPAKRSERDNDIARMFDTNPEAYATVIAGGVGPCNLRATLLAMVYPEASSAIAWKEIPQDPTQYALADDQLRAQLAALPQEKLIDLFNIARFPKTAIRQTARIIKRLRDENYSGTSFTDVMTGMKGVRKIWIEKNCRLGPLSKT